MSDTNAAVDNGVNVAALLEARAALTETPAAAAFKWRATCKWVKGTHSRSTIESFFGLGEEQSHRTEFSFVRIRGQQGAQVVFAQHFAQFGLDDVA